MRHARWAGVLGLLVAAGCGSGSPPGEVGGSGPPPGTIPVHLVVDGSGSVAVDGAVTQRCDASCELAVSPGGQLTLLAQPAEGQVLSGWEGACTGTEACALTISAETTVTAHFAAAPAPPPGQHVLTVLSQGDGAGTVRSAPGGLDCGTACAAPFDEGTEVTLTATAADGSTFAGWGGACSGTDPCQVTLDVDVVVSARFEPPPPPARHTLTVARSGAGSGTVTSAPAGIDCGDTCSAPFDQGTQVTLIAAPAQGSVFAGWSGGCTGTDPCTVALAADTSVEAGFAPAPEYTVTEIVSSDGQVVATDMNAGGDVVGYVVPDDGQAHPFFYRAGTGELALLPPTDRPAYADAVNGAGLVVIRDADNLVYRYQDGALTPVDTGGPAVPTAVDSGGTVVGFTLPGDGSPSRGFVASGDGLALLTGLPGSPESSSASAIDDAGRLVGASGELAVRFVDGVAQDLGLPPRADALGLSGTGWVAGSCEGAGKRSQGYLLDLTTRQLTRVDPEEDDYSLSFSLVDGAGSGFGTALRRSGFTHAMRWRGGHLQDLHGLVSPDPGFLFEWVTGLASDGRLVVGGRDEGGRLHAAVLTPVAP
ncbi:MAG: hypothetical protein QM767_26480 [Anaeromyxobacter sp.]